MKNNEIIAVKQYFKAVKEATSTSFLGATLTFRHLKNAIINSRRKPSKISDKEYFQNSFSIETLQYPKEKLPVPDVGRYKLHNEIDDCIVCDKCAKICPVNCIDIEAIKSPEVIGETSDGTQKRLYAAKFDIDMAKCCFCGLCTTVCPTECLTMTKDYEFSQFDVTNMNFQFSDMTSEEITQKQQVYDTHLANKAAQKATSEKITTKIETTTTVNEETKVVSTPKPSFKPKVITPKITPTQDKEEQTTSISTTTNSTVETLTEQTPHVEIKEKSQSLPTKPIFKPKIPIKKIENTTQESNSQEKTNPENKE